MNEDAGVQEHAPDVRHLWETLRRWLWLVGAGALVFAGLGYAVSSSLTPVYEAKAILLVNQGQRAQAGASYDDVMTSERLTRTYAELIRTEPIVRPVMAQLGLTTPYEQLVKRIDARPLRDTQLISVAVEGTDASLAAETANGLARTFIGHVAEAQAGQTSSAKEVLAREIAELEAQIKKTMEEIEGARREASENGSARLGLLQSELSQQQLTYAQLLRNQHEMALSEARVAHSVRLAAPASVPVRPISPDVRLYTLAAGLVGLVLCLAAAFLLEYFNDAVRTPALVERVTGLHTLGSVAQIGRRNKRRRKYADGQQPRVLVSNETGSAHSEAFRILRTNIEFAQVDGVCRTLMVTSANPGEGKSTVAVNLATVIAQTGKCVVLVDADLRRPTVHQTLGLDNRQGLTNLLLRDEHPLDVVQSTSLPGSVLALTSGPIPPNPAELLGSARMEQLLARLEEMVDVVIVDAPPVLAVADPVVLSTRVGGVIVVADAERTSVDALRRTCEALRRAGANMLGVVLNRLTANTGGYYYRYDGGDERPAAEPAAEPTATGLALDPAPAR